MINIYIMIVGGNIWQHMVNNDVYPYCWFFEDERFGLQDGEDEIYLVDGNKKYKEKEDIEKNKQKGALTTAKLNIESEIQFKEMKLCLVNMSLDYGLYLTGTDMAALQEFFLEVNSRKLYEVEQYHQKHQFFNIGKTY